MSVPNWNDLLLNHRAIQTLSPDQLKAAGQAADNYGMTLGCGIAAIGSLLAGYSTNEDHGIDPDAMTDLGWLLQTLGELSARLNDTGNVIRDRRQALKHED
ncbi:hypothetical protein [Azotobacter beijerinckii]|uniref:hypothetical protein n=1 Tax=Azotobacter beijerinckii TaxID=170623 RepID=UPI002954C3FC|nr:hypothetical protein [Azotobacter beijerinckii]MDV7210124.1 hypothetical protein [Azotobacter beijerinckii]